MRLAQTFRSTFLRRRSAVQRNVAPTSMQGAVRQLSKGNRNVERYRKEPAGRSAKSWPGAKTPIGVRGGSGVVAPRRNKIAHLHRPMARHVGLAGDHYRERRSSSRERVFLRNTGNLALDEGIPGHSFANILNPAFCTASTNRCRIIAQRRTACRWSMPPMEPDKIA